VFVICLFGLSNEHENVSQDIDNIPMDSALITVVTDDVTINISKLRFTDSDYLFGIFWPLYCLSFDLLITSLVSPNFSYESRYLDIGGDHKTFEVITST
jgi:hypothetical protein